MRNNNGYTMIELIAVLIIISVITATIIPKMISFETSAERKLLAAVLDELNAREHMSFLDCKLGLVCVDARTDDLVGISLDKKGTSMIFDGGGTYPVYRVDATEIIAGRWYEGKAPKPPKKPKK